MSVCDCAPKTIFTCVWMTNKKCPQCFKVIMFLLHLLFPMASQNVILMLEYHYCSRIYESVWTFCLVTHRWAIFSIYAPNILHCYRSLLKSEQSLAPVVKPNNLIPPNVPTSLSSYMSHNIISAIFSDPHQSLSDRFHMTSRENMCPPYKTADFTGVCQEQVRSIGMISTFIRESLIKTDLRGVNDQESFYGHCTLFSKCVLLCVCVHTKIILLWTLYIVFQVCCILCVYTE